MVFYKSFRHPVVMFHDPHGELKVDALSGLWTRSLIAWGDGQRDVTTRVAWLQGVSIFADLRQPAALGRFIDARCLNHLTIPECYRLAAQEAFAGVFVKLNETFEWQRVIDFQPGQGTGDIGRLFWQGDILVEEGVEANYTEHWHRDPQSALSPRAAVTLRAVNDGRWGCLLRVGAFFMLTRDREGHLTGGTLTEAVAGADNLRAARALVDFEVSLGTVSGNLWRITRSSLPFRENSNFLLTTLGSAGLDIADLDANGEPITRRWEITYSEGDISAIVNTSMPNATLGKRH